MKDLAEKTLDGTVPTLAQLKKMDDAEIVSRLVQVRGIGTWSVEMLLIFRLGRPDVLPASDFGVRNGFMLTYGHDEMPTPKVILEYGERWRPFRSVASWYMSRTVDLLRKKAAVAEKKSENQGEEETQEARNAAARPRPRPREFAHARIFFTTSPSTSVRRKSRPWKLKVSLLWSRPSRCKIVACRS